MNRLPIAAALAAACLLPATAGAAVFCVDTSTEIRNALVTAASNGEADEIRIVRGTYYASGAAPFAYNSSESYGLRIVGGWTLLLNNCVSYVKDASRTTLDGAGVVPALSIVNFSSLDIVPITVEGLTLRNGFADATGNDQGSGLVVYGYAEAALQVNIDRVIVRNNVSAQNLQPAVILTSDHDHIRFTNSVVRDNVTQDAPAVRVHSNHGGSSLNHITVLNNVRGGLYNGAIEWIGQAHWLEDSAFFGNSGGSGVDIGAFGGVTYQNVFYGTSTGPFLGGVQIANPQLDSLGRPLSGSPLRNNGGWRLSATDVWGSNRLLGGYSDIGASEFIE